MMVRRIALQVAAVIAVATPALAQKTSSDSGQQAVCSLYKVTTALLNITKDPRNDGAFKDVVEGGDVACVSRSQRVGDRDFGYIDYRMRNTNERHPVEGWGQLSLMIKLSPTEIELWQRKAAAPPGAAPPAGVSPDPAKLAAVPAEEVLRWDQPIPIGAHPVIGSTFDKLTHGSPLFPPIDGLPDALWKDKTCSDCHKWQRDTLCIQGETYVKSPQSVFRHPHPFTGFKVALMRWASSGCQ
jgi:hypothetical protein